MNSNNFNQSNNENTTADDSINNGYCNESDSESNESNWCGGDIPGGFQTLNPQIFNIIGEILSDVVSGKMPFNVQNAVGNWIQLVGQVIETYSAQQQYFQSGPGRYYNLKNFNVTNPFCPSSEEESSNNTNESNLQSNDLSTSGTNNSEVDNLKLMICEIEKNISDINNRLNSLENHSDE